ncbi:S-layer homology domain-containing protein [Paenibacillus rhizovicinus]|uniref:S-layer homology domain-containing protein n=1 Tax=Paenibacillus rhizovicinus TaxID=2704463 RepID=A0A6C0P5Z4_9BACL|nr:YDG domain-containing protein [Paenibacillus rhizovicinus]QHW33875.1 S-layer homology domain-containing protein [Paenibacillus rhizovicinus]
MKLFVAAAILLTLVGVTAGSRIGPFAPDAANAAAPLTQVTISGLKVADKNYDGNTSATIDWSGATLGGVTPGDSVSINHAGVTAAFADLNAGANKPATISGLSLSGADAGKYALDSSTMNVTATINKTVFTVNGLVVNNKTYDGTTSGSIDYSHAVVSANGYFDADIGVYANGIAAFSDKNAGNGKQVTITGFTVGGRTDAASLLVGNYIVNPVTLTADITPKALTIDGITATNKTYDGTTAATINVGAATLTGKVGSDDLRVDVSASTADFAGVDAGNGQIVVINGLAIGGTDKNNYALTSTSAYALANITPKPLTLTGLAGIDKVYDGTTGAQVSYGGIQFTGVIISDFLTLNFANQNVAFSDKNAGNGKLITVTGLAITGPDAANYTLNPVTATANIMPKQLSVTGITANDKTYDGDAGTTLDFSAANLTGKVGTDDVSLDTAAVTGAFANKDAGNGKSVAISGLALKGAASGNYTLSSTTAAATADIMPKTISVTGIAANDKIYDGETTAMLDFSAASLTGKVGTDDVSLDTAAVTGTFSDEDAAAGKSVAISGLALKGAAGGNYTLSSTTAAATADITPKQVSVTGITADDKTYDGDANATLDFSAASLTGKVGTDDVSLDTASVTGTFSDRNSDTGKSVAISGLALSGAASGNYTLASATATATADITPKPLAVTGITARNKTYDGKTTAKIDVGTAALTGIVGTDDVGLDASAAAGEFADRKTGRGKTVTVSGLALTGTDAGNYTLDPYTTTANINSVSVDPGPGQEVAPENHDLWTETTSQLDGNAVTTATVNQTELEALLAEGQARHITIDVQAESDDVRIVLNGQMIQMLNDNNATLEIRTGRSTYTLNAQQLNIDQAVKQWGQSISLQDVIVQIELASPSSEMLKVAEDAAVAGKFTVQVPPVEFAIHVDYEGASVPVSSFSAYVKRTIALPDDVDPAKITTAVVIETNGTVHHVPTKIVQVDGKFYAQISSLTNSTYAVIWHPVAFSDMTAHWAKAAVNDMGSRMIIEGTGDGRFNPDGEITRAEFLAILVRGLGLKPTGGSSTFTDVKATDWFASAVNTAAAYQLVTGDKNGAFLPNDKITREQAMTILSKAMKLTGLQNKLSDAASDTVLHSYADAAAVSAWARSGVADSVLAGIVTGKSNGKLAPKDHMTRAETATVIQRLLQQSDLI